MLKRIKIEKFQSLESVDLPLGPLTVIVGPTNSGKSAFVRAVTSLGRNSVPATTGVRVGSKAYSVTADFAEGASVSIERGTSLSRYKTWTQDGEDTYEKAGQTVPAGIAEVLRFAMAEDADLAFSTQHDGPFMMSANGSSVARVLGSLTAATLLHDAVKEANRRKLSHDRQAKTREEDADALATRARGMGGLKERVKALAEARAALDAVAGQAGEVQALRLLLSEWTTVESALGALAEQTPLDTSRIEPVLEAVEAKAVALGRLRALLGQWTDVESALAGNDDVIYRTAEHVQDAEQALVELWAELGVCPTCGKPS